MNNLLKNICTRLYRGFCYYRQPKSHFYETIGQEYTDMLVKKGYLKDSPKIEFIRDYKEPCYEFDWRFRLIFNYYTTTFWEFVKYFLIMETIENIQNKLKH